MMKEYWTKKQRKELRELQGLAWERELCEALKFLREDFDAWEAEEISPFELTNRIHKFHNGRSREIFNSYSGSADTLTIEIAVVKGVIDESELSEELRGELSENIAYFRERRQKVKGETETG